MPVDSLLMSSCFLWLHTVGVRVVEHLLRLFGPRLFCYRKKKQHNSISFHSTNLCSRRRGVGSNLSNLKCLFLKNIMSIKDLSRTQDNFLQNWVLTCGSSFICGPAFTQTAAILTGDPRVLRSIGICREKEPLFSCCTWPSLILTVLI